MFVGGGAAQGVDFLQRSYHAFPWLVLALLTLTYPLLLRAFGSLLLPLKALLLNLLRQVDAGSLHIFEGSEEQKLVQEAITTAGARSRPWLRARAPTASR